MCQLQRWLSPMRFAEPPTSCENTSSATSPVCTVMALRVRFVARNMRRDYLSIHLHKVHPGYEHPSSPMPSSSTSIIPDHPASPPPSVEDAAETEERLIHFAIRFSDRIPWPAGDGRVLVLLGPSVVYGVLIGHGAPLPEIAEQFGLGIRSLPDYAVLEARHVLPPCARNRHSGDET